MAIPVICKKCGTRFPSSIVGGTGSVSFENCATNCPACGAVTPIEDGTYEIANSALRSFRALDVPELLRLQAVLEDGRSKPSAEIANAAKDIDPALGKLVQVLQALGGLPLIVALLALYLQHVAHVEDSADQEAVLTELRASNANQEQLIEGMRQLIEAHEEPAMRSETSSATGGESMSLRTASGSDRPARRRALKLERKALK